MSYNNNEMERALHEELIRRQMQGQQQQAPAGAAAMTSYLRNPEYIQLGLVQQAPTQDYYTRPLHVTHPFAASTTHYSSLAEAQQQAALAAQSRSYVDPNAYARQLYQESLLRQAQQQQQQQTATTYFDPRLHNTAFGVQTLQFPHSEVMSQQQAGMNNAALEHAPTPAAESSEMDYASSPEPKSSPEKPKLDPSLVVSLKRMEAPERRIEGNKVIEEESGEEYFLGERALGLDDDKYWLTELQIYLRHNFAEAFSATENDIAAPMHGRNKPIALGQVGIRCIHCKHANPIERGQQATSYPSMISGIYNSVQQMLRLHLENCFMMPSEVREKIEQLRESTSARGGRKQYWMDSAIRIGLKDTKYGIHFARDPKGPLPPLTGLSVTSREGKRKKMIAKYGSRVSNTAPKESEPKVKTPPKAPTPPPVDARPLVFPEDKDLISDYLYLTLEQMAPCKLTEIDQVGCYKGRDLGSPGLACRHCVGQAGSGRYFPASEASLSQTTTSQTIMNHVRNCRRCPIEIREKLEIMKRTKAAQDRKTSSKPRHGGRKVFFHRLFCRISDLPIVEEDLNLPPLKTPKTPVATTRKRRRRKYDYDSYDESSAEEQETIPKSLSRAPKRPPAPWYHGSVSLAKSDDRHWLSELECFVREELVEVFSFKARDSLAGYIGEREPCPGQLGIRCKTCKSLDPSERTNGCITFPMTVSHFQPKVSEMIRVHFGNCPSLSSKTRRRFNELKPTDTNVDAGDSGMYWLDAAKDLGISNLPAEVTGWGVTFRRDPLKPSPSDDLENDSDGFWLKDGLVGPSDKGLCTDVTLLVLNQFRLCRFKPADRGTGPGSGSREREAGFAGIGCVHCAGDGNTGRFFPTNTKRLIECGTMTGIAHITSCVQCPESIKASVGYLNHRAVIQKVELSGSWKKHFFQLIWNRLHDSNPNQQVEETAPVNAHEGSDEDPEEEEASRSMAALIKAATLWLEEQDGYRGKESSDSGKKHEGKSRTKRRR